MVSEELMNVLPETFVPGKWDVLCQRGKECYEHSGNRRFRMLIAAHLGQYIASTNRREKTRLVSNIVRIVYARAAKSSGGGFVKRDLLARRWIKLSEKQAHEKVSQALRDARKMNNVGPSSKQVIKEKSAIGKPSAQPQLGSNLEPIPMEVHSSGVSVSTLRHLYKDDISPSKFDMSVVQPSSNPLCEMFNGLSCESLSKMPFHPIDNSLVDLLSY